MELNHFNLTNFRNFSRLDVDVPGGLVLLVGGNAQGKTSLLEAIFYMATFVSFQTANDRQLINFLVNKEPLTAARIAADIRYRSVSTPSGMSDRTHHMEVKIIQGLNNSNGVSRLRKEILFDGVKKKMSAALGNFNAVLFLPQMLRVVEGSPEERRRYLNMAMSQAIPNFAKLLIEYRRIVTQRNALLKQIGDRGGDRGQLSYWDEKLASTGAKLIHDRIRTIQELERIAANIHRDLSGDQEALRLSYQPAFDPLENDKFQYSLSFDTPLDRSGIPLDEIQNGFMRALSKISAEEISRGVTTIGPHRDELRFLSNGIDLGLYGSRGQARTAVLAMKLAEVDWIKDKTGQWPVLLLDEVLAELDPVRRADLLTRVLESEQALLTTTDLEMFSPSFVKQVQVWHIQEGQISE
ncbi:DNA replication/repair protein RecF [Chloroflexota bacterium]